MGCYFVYSLTLFHRIGSIAAVAGMSVFGVLQFWPLPGPIIGVIAVGTATNMFIGNVLEPKIQGDNLGLSPFVILVSLLAWGWLWGFVGLILAVPMTVIVKILCENIPVLEPVSVILGSYKSALHKNRPKLKPKKPGRTARFPRERGFCSGLLVLRGPQN